ncbi:zinc finger BED domain-containing protein RICESLEEPER 2-like [Oryza sativa Japonica Group]|nr:zinc finger BED domain-containing protein RICESLEEPER 2-like [Oryza sativa Japonica Group]ABF99602.1 BED zinc finger family protein, expressed [Oryza sativa Japonica Group]ABF99603.1 BED zinc finger family protein, expressed [Oryza sativa Japonica Group]BAF13646.2 Os03g0822100 [Oryza sativa Japonica Group]BAG94910.1 unnamed protein product [Oryza sativa Japonica Group]|eukprot:NP_001051732.2 Os03g0822100 [Oryza sativa Japonica Group]
MEAPAGGGYLLGGQPARCSGGHSTGSNGEGFGGHPATSPPSSSWVSLTREHNEEMRTPNAFFGLGTNSGEDIEMGDGDSDSEQVGPVDEHVNPVIQALTRKFRSEAWKEFVPILIDNEVGAGKCKHCDTEIRAKRGAGTSSLRKHLTRCKKRISALKIVGNLDSTLMSPNSVRLKNWSFDPEVSRKELMRMIVLHELPFQFVEYDGFRSFAASLNPYFKIISRTTIRNDCIAAFKEQKLAMKDMFKGANCRFSLTADMWTSNQTMGYMCVTCHFIDTDWRVQKRIIKFFGVKTPHTGVQMFNAMLSCIQDWNIADKIFSVTLDYASANDSMAKLLKCNLKAKKTIPAGGKLLHNRCATHVINLIAKDGLKVIDSIVCNIRESVKYRDNSLSRKEKFEEIIAQEGITCELHPTVDVCTRWNSTYLMLNAAFPFMRAYASLAVQDKNYKYAPSPDQWERSTIVSGILKVLYDATMVVSGSLYPTSNLYFHEMWKIKLVLDKEHSNNDTEVASMVQKMKDKFDKYWLKSYKYLCIPVIFDPRFKFNFVEFRLGQAFGENAKERIDKVKKRMNMLFKEYSDKLKDSNANPLRQAEHVMAISENDPMADWVQHISEQ